jgi:hypothetical protein
VLFDSGGLFLFAFQGVLGWLVLVGWFWVGCSKYWAVWLVAKIGAFFEQCFLFNPEIFMKTYMTFN